MKNCMGTFANLNTVYIKVAFFGIKQGYRYYSFQPAI